MHQEDKCCLYCWAICVPPVAVCMINGCGIHFWLNVVLSCCTYFGGVIHAIILINSLYSIRVVAPVVAAPVMAPTVVAPTVIPPPMVATPVMGPPMARGFY